MGAQNLLITPNYLPCTAYVAALCQYPKVTLEVCHTYEKQTYQNRCHIDTSQGVQKLIIPIQHGAHKQPYKDVMIDYATPWHIKHMRALTTAYSKAPYYHAVTDYLFPLLKKKPTTLLALNLSLLTFIREFLQINLNLTLTDTYHTIPAPSTLDRRTYWHPKKKNPTIEKETATYKHLFSTTFIPNLSVIDLLYCEGPYAKKLLMNKGT